MSLPALVLVPGAYTPTTTYNALIPILERLGLETYALPLQTVGKRPLPAPHMYDDAAFIAAEVRKLVDKGKRVCTQGLSVKQRAAQGKAGGIVRLVYLSAIVLRRGETASGGEPGDLAGAGHFSHYLTFDLDMALRFSLSDLPREEALPFAHMSQAMSAVSQVDPLTWAGYADVPSTYIITTRDQALSVDRQLAYVQVLKEHAPEGAGPEVLEIESGHAPNASRPEELAQMLKGVVERAGPQ